MSAEFMRIKDVVEKHFPWLQYVKIDAVVKDLLAATEPAPDLDRAEALIEKAKELRLDAARLSDLEARVIELARLFADHQMYGGHHAKGVSFPPPPPYSPPPPFAPTPAFPQPYIGDVPPQTWPPGRHWYSTGGNAYKFNPNTGTADVDD